MAQEKRDEVTFTIRNEKTVERLRRDGKVSLPKKKIDIPKDRQWNKKIMTSMLLKGLENGESIRKISKSILPEIMSKTDLTGKTDEEIKGIVKKNIDSSIRNARTMVTSAENNGKLDSYKDLSSQGVVMKKEWIATPDDRTRQSHIDIDGEEQDLDKPFSNGCMFPGDAMGPPEEVWNCRCAMGTHIIGFRRADGSVSEVQYDRDNTLHDRQMEEERDKREKSRADTFRLIGGKGDAEITDNISDYYLPENIRDKFPKYEKMKSYNDFKDYFDKQGIHLDTDLNALKNDRANDDIEAVNTLLRKIAVSVDTYKDVFGNDALKSLKNITLYANDLDTRASYFFNLIGENDPLAGTIKFRDWNASGRDVFHELAHALQDSMKSNGEDVITFADRIAKELDIPTTAYRGSSGLGEENAEMMAEVLAFGFTQGKDRNIDFIDKLRKLLRR